VYASSPNLMVNGLSQSHLPDTRTTTVASLFSESGMVQSQAPTSLELNPSSATTDTICAEHFGERPVSWRSLLKRYMTTFHSSVSRTAPAVLKLDDTIYPGVSLSYHSAPVTWANDDLWSYVRLAYVGMRGSMKKRIRFVDTHTSTSSSGIAITLKEESDTLITPALSTASLAASPPLAYTNGSLIYSLSDNTGIEVDFPFYSRNLFHYAFNLSDVGNNPGGSHNMDETWTRNYAAIATVLGSLTTTGYVFVESSIGEDFTFLRFQGCPYYIRTL